ncbi:hypothetical protein B0T10DRAFT_551731 [Thelonectria olida]|uniref:Uncharacterized protein n=1 Tax=Thelonectria olida TaxID=1576542 RepID=A0A9P8VWX4_9HYPO|nr:hypothetical protein B0T10DRAFT_551731 [Thelonectria olida]
MGSTTILRGFKVSVAALDAFLDANGADGTYGAPPFYEDHPDKDELSKLLYRKIIEAGGTAIKDNFRVMIPSREGHNLSTIAYVTYTWVTIYAQREIQLTEDLPEEVPKGFEELRTEILSYNDSVSIAPQEKIKDDGKMGLYVVYTYEIRGLYTPQELLDRYKDPQTCDYCDAVFRHSETTELDSVWKNRQLHRMKVHGSEEGTNSLPNA